jgi:hypothetical protein
MPRFVFILLLLSLSIHSVSAGEYVGDKLLEILGESKGGEAFSKFKTEYLLDRGLKNPEMGIKLTATHYSVSLITAITVTAAGYEINDVKYRQFEGSLPFGISLSDDEAGLEQKFGPAKGKAPSGDDVRMKFKKEGITVNIYFKNSSRRKIAYIKFTQNIGVAGPYRIAENGEAPEAEAPEAAPNDAEKDAEKPKENKAAKEETITSAAAPAPATASDDARPAIKLNDTRTATKNVPSLPTHASKATAAETRVSSDPFYMAVMSVIESGEEEMFKDIKKDPTPKANFWNYKYTYATSVSIPGEKYNMLYSFPFQSSQLDFVSVLAESDGASAAIQAKYAEVEAKLKADFKPSDGWSYMYTVNPEDPKGIKDLELKNPKLGSIVLDYSINPYGKHVLYLRFLLQYT